MQGLVILQKGEYSFGFADNTVGLLVFELLFLEVLRHRLTVVISAQFFGRHSSFLKEVYFLVLFHFASFTVQLLRPRPPKNFFTNWPIVFE